MLRSIFQSLISNILMELIMFNVDFAFEKIRFTSNDLLIQLMQFILSYQNQFMLL